MQVSPHEFMQQVMAASSKRFTIEKKSDPVEFLSWLLNTIHSDLTDGKRKKPSIISKCFQVRSAQHRSSHLSASCFWGSSCQPSWWLMPQEHGTLRTGNAIS